MFLYISYFNLFLRRQPDVEVSAPVVLSSLLVVVLSLKGLLPAAIRVLVQVHHLEASWLPFFTLPRLAENWQISVCSSNYHVEVMEQGEATQ